ncbi:hypothetical protein [Dokdonia sp.]|uniref:hypothetical protein n=1 Tax=Dokdonia sp. TaxID=2024995 RepID=UPI0032632D10
MFWKRKPKIIKTSDSYINNENPREDFPYLERSCQIYISEKYQEILFVPYGKMESWMLKELDAVVVKKWPMDFGDLQNTILTTLDTYEYSLPDQEPNIKNWHSFNSSKAKTQRSFKTDYISISLRTDLKTKYGQKEVERIIVETSPFDLNKDSYKLTGTAHLIETGIAQIVLDIFHACLKIKK